MSRQHDAASSPAPAQARREWASTPLGTTVRPPGEDDGPLFTSVWHDVVQQLTEAGADRRA